MAGGHEIPWNYGQARVILAKPEGGRLQKLEFVMPEYRRKKGSDVWHWCRNCGNWPTSDYESIKTSEFPADGKLDDECRVKELVGNCRTNTPAY